MNLQDNFSYLKKKRVGENFGNYTVYDKNIFTLNNFDHIYIITLDPIYSIRYFKLEKKYTRLMYKMCSNLTVKMSERCCCFVFLTSFKNTQHITEAIIASSKL